MSSDTLSRAINQAFSCAAHNYVSYRVESTLPDNKAALRPEKHSTESRKLLLTEIRGLFATRSHRRHKPFCDESACDVKLCQARHTAWHILYILKSK